MPTVNRKRTVSVCRGHTDFTCIDAKVITHAKMQLKERILQEKIFPILAWEIPWTGEPSRLIVLGVTKSQTSLSD